MDIAGNDYDIMNKFVLLCWMKLQIRRDPLFLMRY